MSTMSAKLFASAAVSLAVAGTCLAAPAFAATDSSSLGSMIEAVAQAAEQSRAADTSGAATTAADSPASATDSPAAASDAVAASTAHTVFGGLAFDLPQGYTRQESSDESIGLWGNEANTSAVAVYDLRDTEIPAESKRADYFAKVAQASLEGFDDVTVEELDADDELGLAAYSYAVSATDADGDYVFVQLYVPMEEGGFTFMQVGYTVGKLTSAQVDELIDVIDSLKLAGDDASGAAGQKVSSCGLTFELPEGVSAYDGDEDCWMDERGDIIVKAVDHVVEGASKLTADDYVELLEQLAPTGDSADSKVTALGSDVVEGQDVTSLYASYKVVDPDATMYSVVIVAPVADDSLSVVIVWCSEEGSQRYGTAVTAMMESFKQA